MKILIVDDSPLWIRQGMLLLGAAGHEVEGLCVIDPKEFISNSLDRDKIAALDAIDVLLVDKDIGRGVTSTRFICVVRQVFPRLPIIRWTSDRGWGKIPYMQYLGVSCVHKPNKQAEVGFVESFNQALAEQRLILSGPMGIFTAMKEVVDSGAAASEVRSNQLQELFEIAQLAEKGSVRRSSRPGYAWAIFDDAGESTKHQLGHCVCDGVLTAADIDPHLPALQKVIAKFETAGNIDERFEITANFIKAGKLEELELVAGGY